jgi:hypothetical protein
MRKLSLRRKVFVRGDSLISSPDFIIHSSVSAELAQSLLLLLGSYFDHLELTLVPFPVDFQLLSGPIADGACAELLLWKSYVCDLLRAFVEFDSGHGFLASPMLDKVARPQSEKTNPAFVGNRVWTVVSLLRP